MACQSTSSSDFNSQKFLSESASQGGFDAFVQAVARRAYRGDASGVSNFLSADSNSDLKAFFLNEANDIAADALGSLPAAGKALAGWILDQIFNLPGQQGSVDKIGPQLQAIGKQLDEILAGLSALSNQIAQFEKSITDLVKLEAYQQQAQDVQNDIDSLCDIQDQLIFLADSDPTEDHTQYAMNVENEIQVEGSKNLKEIWSGLEGLDSLVIPGLINRWSDLVGPGPGYPIFTDSTYLTSAVPNFEYYLGAETVGFNLQIELAHALAFQKQPSLANQIIKGAITDFNDHYDIEVKRIAHDQEIGGTGTTGLFAGVALPSGFENWTIDTRSGLMWMKRQSCDNGTCVFAEYDKTGGWGRDASLAPGFINDSNNTLNNTFPDLLLTFEEPTRDQWAGLIDSDRENVKEKNIAPFTWLESKRFNLGNENNLSWWTSDLAKESPGSELFPDWANWLVDLRIVNPNAGQFWWQIKGSSNPEGIGNLLLVSGAPLANPNLLLYRSMQDALSDYLFVAGPSMKTARQDATATPLLNGKILIAGGLASGRNPVNSTELYDPLTNTFADSAPMNTARYFAIATLLASGKVLIAGGDSASTPDEGALSSTELYNPVTNSFTSTAPSMSTPRAFATATLLPNWLVLIAGGDKSGGTGFYPLSSTELYDPSNSSFTTLIAPSMNSERFYATATLLPNGKVLIAGGFGEDFLSSTELYDYRTNSFAAATPSMNTGRGRATAILLPNGEVLIVGGIGENGVLKSTELYDSVTNSFASSSPSMNTARYDATATSLPNGKVLITGGYEGPYINGPALKSTELYDPATNTLASSSPSMNIARRDFTATLLPNSKVLMTGGEDDDNVIQNSTELYTVSIGATLGAPLPTPSPIPTRNPIPSATTLPTPTAVPTAAVSLTSTSVSSVGAPGATVAAGTFTIRNSLNVVGSVTSATISVSHATLFSSMTLSGGGQSATATPPSATTTFTFPVPIIVPARGSVTLSLSAVIGLNPVMLGRAFQYASLTVNTPSPSNRGVWPLEGSLALLGIALMALPNCTRRRALIIAVLILGVAAAATGCGGGSNGPTRFASTQQVTAVAFTTGGTPDRVEGIPAPLGTISE